MTAIIIEYLPALVTFTALLGILIVAFVGGSISVGPKGISFTRREKSTPEGGGFVVPYTVFEKVESEIGEVSSILYSAFLTQLKQSAASKGIEINENRLDDYEETQHISLLTRVITYKGNGMESIQRVITKELKSGRWCGNDPRDYARNTVVPQILSGCVTNGINLLYENTALSCDGTEITRIVSKADLWETWQGEFVRNRITEVIVRFFEYAKAVSNCEK